MPQGDTQADLTERARALAERLWWVLSPDGELRGMAISDAATELAAFAQSEREAAAAAFQSERAQRASAYNQLFDDYQKAVREKEAAAAEARRALETISHLARKPDGGRTADEMSGDLRSIADTCRRAIASPPAPQEETR